MKLRSLREKDIIAALKKEFADSDRGLILGIGDDAALVRGRVSRLFLTTDLLIEGIHFLTALHPPYELGRKALYVNLSDIAAMGGTPRYALLGLGLKADLGRSWAEKFFQGFKAAAKESGTCLVGGDISASKKVVISVTVMGEGKRAVKRSGARPGDLIFVSGSLGDAAAGLRLLRRGLGKQKDDRAQALIQAFLDPKPPLSLGPLLARRRLATSMIDTSDGLSIDLAHLCEESQTGAEVYVEKLPLSEAIRVFETRPLALALHGGEDYQLLFTVSPRNLPSLANLQKRFPLHWIGRMTSTRSIWIMDKKGRRSPLLPKGYQHFARGPKFADRSLPSSEKLCAQAK